MSTLTLEEKKKSYLKIGYALAALTLIELCLVSQWSYNLMGHKFATLLVVIASVAKAVIVGWYYMHLNHETKGLKIILLFPLFVAVFYVTYLSLDVPNRRANVYVGEPKRFFGKRMLHERQVDDFGNTIVEEPVKAAPHAEGHAEESKTEVKEETKKE